MNVYTTPLYDDFTGFTFNGQHSSQFGLLRVSDGDRYEDDLVLSHNDEAADIPGGPGQYYWGETIKNRTFPINVAYDNIGEVDKRRIKKWLHPDDKLHELIFDERPYVKYWVKCSKQVTAKELCFNETYEAGRDDFDNPIEKVRRVYKGEFNIEFTAYVPYGVAVDKSLNGFVNCGNIDEWKESSGLLNNLDNINVFNEQNVCNIYNPGDIESGFRLEFNITSTAKSFTISSDSVIEDYQENFLYEENLLEEKGENDWETTGISAAYYLYDGNTRRSLKLIQKPYAEMWSHKENNTGTGGALMFDQKIMEGQIVEENGRSRFESFSNGQLYDIFYYSSNVKGKKGYVADENFDTIPGISYVFDDVSNIYKIRIQQKTIGEDSKTIISFPYGDPVFSDEVTSLVLKMPETQDIYLECGIKYEGEYIDNKKYYFKCFIPSAINIPPSQWSVAQAMLLDGCKVIFDSNKHNVNYIKDQGEAMTELVGVNDFIKEGKLFTIPVDDFFKAQEANPTFNQFTITSTNCVISNPAIEYSYLYK